MKVKAIKMGFYGKGREAKRIKVGEGFPLLKASEFSSRWMEWVEKPVSAIHDIKAEAEAETPRPRGNPMWRKK